MSVFASYATSTAFQISLSRGMAMSLWSIDRDERALAAVRSKRERWFTLWNGGSTSWQMRTSGEHWSTHMVTHYHALARRGLVVHDPVSQRDGVAKWHGRPSHQLTEAGRLVLQLCRLAELVPRDADCDVVPYALDWCRTSRERTKT